MAIQRTLPSTKNVDSTSSIVSPSRTGAYLESYVIPLGAKQQVFADEGSYFCTYNVTHGTGIAGHAAPVANDFSLKPLLHIFNSGLTKTITLDFIKLRMTSIGAGATTSDYEVWVDQAGVSCKTSGGTVATAVNCRSDNPNVSGAVVSFGPVVATAHATERMVDHHRVRSTVSVVEDQYHFGFGNPGYGPPTGGITMAGTAVIAAYIHFPPIVVLPGGNFKLVEWGASQSGAHSFEYSVGWIER